MTNTNTIILSPEQISNIVSQITSNVSEHVLSNTTITTNVISPMDFISMQNHIITFWLAAIATILVVGGFVSFSYFAYMIDSEIDKKLNYERSALEEKINPLINNFEDLSTNFSLWMENTKKDKTGSTEDMKDEIGNTEDFENSEKTAFEKDKEEQNDDNIRQ